MHLKRWITGLVAVPFLILLISKGGPFLFAGVISLVCILALWEYFRIVMQSQSKSDQWFIMATGYITGTIIIWTAYMHLSELVLGLILLNFLVCAMIALPQFKSDSSITEAVFKQVLGVIYIPLLLSYLVMIRNGLDGIIWIYLLLIVVFAGDIGAFYVGSYLGRRKLCPAVSPAKTVEGSIGGLAFSVVAGTIFKSLVMPSLPWAGSALFFVAVNLAGQTGDLFESLLKRGGNIKDSGAILPGHGGLLDRIDALLFAAPVAYFLKAYILV